MSEVSSRLFDTIDSIIDMLEKHAARLDAIEQTRGPWLNAKPTLPGNRLVMESGAMRREQLEQCPDGLLPDGDKCPRCGGSRAPSGVGGGTWVHFSPDPARRVPQPLTEKEVIAASFPMTASNVGILKDAGLGIYRIEDIRRFAEEARK